MKQRLEQFLEAENLTKAQFADKIHVARAGITHIMSGRNNPSYEFITNTMEAFPRLNIEWLLKGTGQMYKSGMQEADSVGRSNIKKIVVFFSDGTFREFC